jgi:hypothetical protein
MSVAISCLQILDVIAGYFRLLRERGHASFPSIEQMAQSARVRSIDIGGAIRHLVGLCLIAVRPGSGARRNEYLRTCRGASLQRWRPGPRVDDLPQF